MSDYDTIRARQYIDFSSTHARDDVSSYFLEDNSTHGRATPRTDVAADSIPAPSDKAGIWGRGTIHPKTPKNGSAVSSVLVPKECISSDLSARSVNEKIHPKTSKNSFALSSISNPLKEVHSIESCYDNIRAPQYVDFSSTTVRDGNVSYYFSEGNSKFGITIHGDDLASTVIPDPPESVLGNEKAPAKTPGSGPPIPSILFPREDRLLDLHGSIVRNGKNHHKTPKGSSAVAFTPDSTEGRSSNTSVSGNIVQNEKILLKTPGESSTIPFIPVSAKGRSLNVPGSVANNKTFQANKSLRESTGESIPEQLAENERSPLEEAILNRALNELSLSGIPKLTQTKKAKAPPIATSTPMIRTTQTKHVRKRKIILHDNENNVPKFKKVEKVKPRPSCGGPQTKTVAFPNGKVPVANQQQRVQTFAPTHFEPKKTPFPAAVDVFGPNKANTRTPVKAVRKLPAPEGSKAIVPFRARQPVSLYRNPFVPKQSEKRPTEVKPFRFHTDRRVVERREFDMKVKERSLKLEEERLRLAEEKARIEALEIMELRKVKIHARPVPEFVYRRPPPPELPKKALTVPVTPMVLRNRKKNAASNSVA